MQIRVPGGSLKKLLALLAATLTLACIYGTAAYNLSESGEVRFLDELEKLSLQGKSDAYCARLHPDMSVSIRDHTSPGTPRDFDGGKKQFCEFITMAAKGVDLIGPESTATRTDLSVTRSWLHPWTAQISYHETRTTRLTRINVTVNTQGDDRWTLVQTFSGVQALGLVSESRRAD